MDMKWLSVCEAMTGKLNWAAIIAKKRQLEFAVVDSVNFFGSRSSSSSNNYTKSGPFAFNEPQTGTNLLRDSFLSLSLINIAISEPTVMDLVVNIDVFKIDQVVRNLITNAVNIHSFRIVNR